MCVYFRFSNIAGLNNHLQSEHDIVLEMTKHTFSSFSNYTKWKEEEEILTHSWYVLHSAPNLRDGYEHYYYYCNRAGKYQSRGSRKRALKSQGTSKLSSNCSAYMKVVRCVNSDFVNLTYSSTHYNHKKQLGHLRISSNIKGVVAEKLKQGISSNRIIQDIRESNITGGIGRDHLISEKDLNNIRKLFNTDGIQKHPNDLVSVLTIVEEMQTLDYNVILIFKQQSENPIEKYKFLDINDFLLVLQTEFQREMFVKYGKNGVCMDATYNVYDYNFHLITVIVLDDYQEGIPVAWGISNREDKIVIKYILEAIKSSCGNLSSKWFMSDMAPQYYNAWREVFDSTNTKYLWCAWHIDRAWRKAVKRYFNNLKDQQETYHQLRVLMMETCKTSFQILLTKILTTHKNSLFMEYFQHYCHHVEQWLYVFELELQLILICMRSHSTGYLK